MNHRAGREHESEDKPLGKAWKQYWQERVKDQSTRARKQIHKEKAAARRRIHRRLRHTTRKHLRVYHHKD